MSALQQSSYSRKESEYQMDDVIPDPLMFLGADSELVEKFTIFHRRNPAIYAAFDRFSREARSSGRTRFSHWMVVNRIRWYTEIETQGSELKISNDFIALYARMFVALNPDFAGFFEFKKMKSVRKGSSSFEIEPELGEV